MIGQTKAAGFQIGVRRTFPVSREAAWAFLLSTEGLKLWLGDLSSLELEPGHQYTTEEGNFGELRVVKPLEQLRLTWQRKGWSQPSTLQIRLIPNPSHADKTTISFHQEKLTDAWAREEMKQHWEAVTAAIMEQVGTD
ncbi:SRPBCC domain-containing protein [Paenibacillus sp. Marseille-P2973]|uniref:SRPBCC family protein n=1 Tax=unclassified Paenibacillus TaxID=185978 RepID=UPI001B383718|nr:SRPBCC domain-containing protein [Paenibacillus sp. Marseille-P2973]MBQ4899763.1 SRPBCC domain-containing protein [Paenibacillus sp. Marseille-P2973]